jgi:hypothetical protein
LPSPISLKRCACQFSERRQEEKEKERKQKTKRRNEKVERGMER